MTDWLRGSFPILPTPMAEDGALALGVVAHLLTRLAGHGVRGVVALGSGGEGVYLTDEERVEVVSAIAAHGDVRVVAGVMRYGTRVAVDDAKRLVAAGADALLVSLPQYYRTPLDRVIAHFDAIVSAVDVPVLYYHYPGVTGLRLTPGEMGELFARVPLAGTKESGLSTRELEAHFDAIGRPVQVFTGQSFDLLDTLDAGGVGAMSPVSLLMPRTEVTLVRAHAAGDRRVARLAQRRLFRALPLISPVRVPLPVARIGIRAVLRWGLPQPVDEGLPHAGVKEALHACGLLPSAAVRDPQPRLAVEDARRIHRRALRVVEL